VRDYKKSAEWYRKAAEQDDFAGEYNLGFLYQNGLGVPLDYVEAYKWHALAGERGYGPSRKALAEITQIMTRAQIEEGRRRMSAWAQQHRAEGGASRVVEVNAAE
jgi:TPR repeat protein